MLRRTPFLFSALQAFSFSLVFFQGNFLVKGSDVLFPFTLEFHLTDNEQPLSDNILVESLIAAVAVNHVNQRYGGLVPILGDPRLSHKSCPINFTYSFVDTGGTFSPSVIQSLFRAASTTQGRNLQIVIGPSSSDVAIPLNAFLQNLQIPHISPSASSTDLNGRPFFARTHASDRSFACSIVRYLEKEQYEKFVFLYEESSFGVSFRNDMTSCLEEIDNSISMEGIQIVQVDGQSIVDIDSLRRALSRVEESRLNLVVYSITGTQDQLNLFIEASQRGLTGSGRNWISAATISPTILDDIDDLDTLSRVKAALTGTLQATTTTMPHECLELMREELPTYDKFVDDIRESLPFNISNDIFSRTQDQTRLEKVGFTYDAVVLGALAVFENCDAVLQEYNVSKNGSSEDVLLASNGNMVEINPRRLTSTHDLTNQQVMQSSSFSPLENSLVQGRLGEALFESILEPSITFDGVSGRVEIENTTGSRNPDTVVFVLQNMFVDSNDMLMSRTVGKFQDNSWELNRSILVYPPGNTLTRPSFTNKAIMSYTRLHPGTVYTLWALATLLILLCFVAGIFVFANRSKPVMKASQPQFLAIILFGNMISTSSLFFISIDEENGTPLRLGCQIGWSLWSVGTTLVATSLSVKLYKIHVIFKSEFNKVDLNKTLLYLIIVFVLLADLIILFTFGFVDPLVAERIPIPGRIDPEFGFPTESYLTCTGPDSSAEAFFVTIYVFYFFLYVVLGYMAYLIRNYPEDFQEAKWIFSAMLAQLQSTLLSIPIVLSFDPWDTTERYLLISLSILVSNFLLLFFLFVPKIRRVWCGSREYSLTSRKQT